MYDDEWQDLDIWSSWADRVLARSPELREETRRWRKTSYPNPGVGQRHHTVPRFYLQRFAQGEQMLVRDRETGEASIRNIKDLAIKDFYTFINHDGQRDGRLEQVLAEMETDAATLFERLLSPFHRPRALDSMESLTLALFMSFQLVRGPRKRREMELLADYNLKLVNQHQSWAGGNSTQFVPHPNEHLVIIAKAPPKLSEALCGRPTALVTIDRPLFMTCDEPVIVVTDGDYVRHLPSCFKTSKRRKKDAKRPSRNRKRNRETIHIYPTRPLGLKVAEEVALPLSPTTIILFGPRGEPSEPHVILRGAEAEELADEVNQRLIDQAYQWVAAHPDHPTIRSMTFPPPGPLMQVCDGGTSIGRALNRPPSPRRPARLNRHWI